MVSLHKTFSLQTNEYGAISPHLLESVEELIDPIQEEVDALRLLCNLELRIAHYTHWYGLKSSLILITRSFDFKLQNQTIGPNLD